MFVLVAALQLCWLNPTANVDLTPLTDLAYIRVYREGDYLREFEATEPGARQCGNLRMSPGTYTFRITAVNTLSEESQFSAAVTATESRMAPVTGGRILED